MLRQIFRGSATDDSDSYYRALKAFQLDPEQDFYKLKKRIGLSAATLYAQFYFTHQTRYKRLRRELELHQGESNGLNSQYDVIVVLPPHGTLNKQSTSRFLRQAMGLATSAGFSRVSQAQLNSDRVLIGAKRLAQLIHRKQQMGKDVIIISYSYGSAFVRVMIDQLPEEQLSNVKGWMNVSGMIFGSPLFHCSDKKSLFQNMSNSQRGFSCEQNYFKSPLNSKGIKTIHILGLKTGEALTPREASFREDLKAWGPNDGVIAFAPYQHVEQPVIPVSDQGHDLDLSGLGSTFVRSLSTMVSTVPVRRTPLSGMGANQGFL